MKRPPQPSFNFDEPLEKVLPEWSEVPAALFLSWSERMQFVYCAARDENSALWADSEEEAQWYRERAEKYRSSTYGI